MKTPFFFRTFFYILVWHRIICIILRRITVAAREYEIMCNAIAGRDKTKSWKGDSARYAAIHRWIRRHKPRPKECVKCNKRPPVDVACIRELPLAM